MNFLGMGPLELIVIAALALVVFGPDKLPEIAQQVGKAIGEIRKMTKDVTDEIHRSIDLDPPRTIKPPADSITRPASPTLSPTLPPTPPPPAEPPIPRASARGPDIEPPY
jgi:TatA/E family protein of Tat protein translocase